MNIQKAKKVYKNEGLIPFLSRTVSFVSKKIVSYDTYYLVKRSIQDLELEPEKYKPDIEGLKIVTVTSNAQADELTREYEDFRLYHLNSAQMLDAGVLASCTYIGREVANICWIAATEAGKRAMTDIPYRVDFDNKECCFGNSYTVPKYRRMGLRRYGTRMRYRIIKDMGMETMRHPVNTRNVVGLIASESKVGQQVYARAYRISILGFRYWKEVPLDIPLGELIAQKKASRNPS